MVGLTSQPLHLIITAIFLSPLTVDSREKGFLISFETVYFRLQAFLYMNFRVQRGSEAMGFGCFGEFEGAQVKILVKNPPCACVVSLRPMFKLSSGWSLIVRYSVDL